jgi:N-acetylglutamate synthase-like GNAT family acetyltransferase
MALHVAPIEMSAAAPLLEASGLTLDGLSHTLLLAASDSEERILAVAGFEHFEDVILLRSVAVDPQYRTQGVGKSLCASVLNLAKAHGAHQAFLLTETAEKFFEKLGFETIPRAQADPRILASEEFKEGRCASAVLMTRRL